VSTAIPRRRCGNSDRTRAGFRPEPEGANAPPERPVMFRSPDAAATTAAFCPTRSRSTVPTSCSISLSLLAPELSFLQKCAVFRTSVPEKIKRMAKWEHRPTAAPAADLSADSRNAISPLPESRMPYISRIEAGARTPSVKALRQIAGKLGVTVEHLKTGKPTPIEQSVTVQAHGSRRSPLSVWPGRLGGSCAAK
jgi:hypothetical protein